MYILYILLDPLNVNIINVQLKSIYAESQVIGPLADGSVSWIGGVGHLVLKDVIASRSITVFIKQNSSAGATYKSQRKHIVLLSRFSQDEVARRNQETRNETLNYFESFNENTEMTDTGTHTHRRSRH